MSGSDVERQIERSRQRLARLREQGEREGWGSDSPLNEAMEELGETLEELSITVEELSSTNEELAEAQLAAEEHARRYQDLFHLAPDGYVITDERGVIREVNAVAEQQLGRPGRYLAGKPLLPLVAQADRDAFLECLTALRERRRRLEGRLLRFGAEKGFDASVSAVPERRAGGVEIRWTLRDVSELRERDAFRDEIERHLESVTWLMQLDPPRILHVSRAYEVIWARDPAGVYENPRAWLETVHPDDRQRADTAYGRLIRGERFDAEYRVLRPDGEVRWIHGRGTPFRDARGQLNRAAGVAEDVTEKRRVEAEMKDLERHRRKAVLAAERAEARERRALARDLHDAVSQSLALARARLGAVGDEYGDPDQLARLEEVEALIAEADERTRTLTFRLSPPILHDLGLAATAEWLAEDLERRFGLHVVVREVGEPLPVSADTREALFRSLRELLINVARHAQTDKARVSIVREGETLSVMVEDSGIGFEVGKEERAGFGLLSVRERLEALGGRLEIESRPGRGTCARLVVPAPTQNPGSEAAQAEPG